MIPGPLSWLWLAKGDAFAGGAADAGKLDLLKALLPVYLEVLQSLARQGEPFAQRIVRQQERLGLPAYPTTTIGSFPQTAGIRGLRRHRAPIWNCWGRSSTISN